MRGACVATLLHAGNVENLLGNAGQSVCVLAHDAAQLLLGGLAAQVFGQQRIGLGDGRQRVADFMGHGGRHAPHGGQFFGAHLGFHLAQIVQKHHAQ